MGAYYYLLLLSVQRKLRQNAHAGSNAHAFYMNINMVYGVKCYLNKYVRMKDIPEQRVFL